MESALSSEQKRFWWVVQLLVWESRYSNSTKCFVYTQPEAPGFMPNPPVQFLVWVHSPLSLFWLSVATSVSPFHLPLPLDQPGFPELLNTFDYRWIVCVKFAVRIWRHSATVQYIFQASISESVASWLNFHSEILDLQWFCCFVLM